MSQLSLLLQEAVRRERAARTVLEVLREQMDDAGGARGVLGRRSFKQRLRLNGFGCCGATWGFGRTAAIGAREDEDDQEPREDEDDQEPRNLPSQERVVITVGQAGPVNIWNPDCVAPVSNGSGMNLAAALAAERQFRDPQDTEGEGSVAPAGNNARTGTTAPGTTAPGTPMRVSLMRLLEETEMDGCDAFGGGATADSEKAAEGGIGNDSMCCVCMGRKKGAAFIPCGHTFCRVCSREVWLNRGSCPLCNRSILEILDIF